MPCAQGNLPSDWIALGGEPKHDAIRGAQTILQCLYDRGLPNVLVDNEIVLLAMVYAKAVRANAKPKDIKRGGT
jgi:hypothetical protein